MSDEGLVLKRIPQGGGVFALFYKGEQLPAQLSTSLESNAHHTPSVTVVFEAAKHMGVRIQGDDAAE